MYDPTLPTQQIDDEIYDVLHISDIEPGKTILINTLLPCNSRGSPQRNANQNQPPLNRKNTPPRQAFQQHEPSPPLARSPKNELGSSPQEKMLPQLNARRQEASPQQQRQQNQQQQQDPLREPKPGYKYHKFVWNEYPAAEVFFSPEPCWEFIPMQKDQDGSFYVVHEVPCSGNPFFFKVWDHQRAVLNDCD